MNMPSFWMLQLYSLGIDMFHDGPQHQATGAKTRNPTPKTRKTRNHPRGEVSRNNFDSRCCWIFTQDVLAIEDRRGGLYPIPLTLGFFCIPWRSVPLLQFPFPCLGDFWLIISPCLPFFRGYCSTALNFGCLNCFLSYFADFAGKIKKSTHFGESKTPLGGTLGDMRRSIHGRRAVGRRIVSGQHPNPTENGSNPNQI